MAFVFIMGVSLTACSNAESENQIPAEHLEEVEQGTEADYAIKASTLRSFGALLTPYVQPAAQTVTISNDGTNAITITQPTANNYLIGALSSTSLEANGATATFSVQPKENLEVGIYNETISIQGTNDISATIYAEFEVVAPTYLIDVSELRAFDTVYAPYAQPAAQTVSVSNMGTGAITLTQPTATHFHIGTLSATNLEPNGAMATFTIQPRADLAGGIYEEEIAISGTNGTSTTIHAVFTVIELDGQVKILKQSLRPFPTNIVFLGDGFILEDNFEGGIFDEKVAEFSDYIFSIQPFAEYEDYFSVYSVSALSEERGAKRNPGDLRPRTAFNSTYNTFGIARLLTTQDSFKVGRYARFATLDPHIIVLIVNDAQYGGSGGQIAVSSIHASARGIVVHEIGHVFGLADEYVDEEYRQVAGITLEGARTKPNVDITNNLSDIKWSHFIGLNGYSDSAWEGGYYFSTGVWRPTATSIMRNLSTTGFNAISRETIVKVLLENAGETYEFSDFLRRDDPSVGPGGAMSSVASYPMPVPVEVYEERLYGNQKIRARFRGETE